MPKAKILYVEDELFLAKIVKESLESRDFEVKLVMDGSKVIETLEGFTPDLCLLDVMLPNVDGFFLGKTIRNEHLHLPIIFITAKSQTEDVLQGFKSGGNDYIKKPFSMEELIVRIDNLLHLAHHPVQMTEPNTCVNMGQYHFFPNKYELKLYQHPPLRLSHRETELLKIFADNQNQAIDRKYILQTVWGDDSFFNSRNLDVYIRKLREYLKDDPHLQIITLKGVGYRFVNEKA